MPADLGFMHLLKNIFSGWSGDRRGATAIEFALVAVPFVMITVAIVELSVFYAANAVLLGATQDAVRAVRTGQVQAISDPDEADALFREQMCNHIPIRLIDCNAIQFQVEVLESFASADTSITVDEDGNMSDDTNYGEEEDVMMITVLYYHPMISPLTAAFFADSPNNTKLLTGVFVFQTEPYKIDRDAI